MIKQNILPKILYRLRAFPISIPQYFLRHLQSVILVSFGQTSPLNLNVKFYIGLEPKKDWPFQIYRNTTWRHIWLELSISAATTAVNNG